MLGCVTKERPKLEPLSPPHFFLAVQHARPGIPGPGIKLLKNLHSPCSGRWSVKHRIIREVPLSPHFKRQILSMGYLLKTHNQDIMPYISNAELTFLPDQTFFSLKTHCLLKALKLEPTFLAPTNVLISFFLELSYWFSMGLWFSSITFWIYPTLIFQKVQSQLCHSSFKRKVLMAY